MFRCFCCSKGALVFVCDVCCCRCCLLLQMFVAAGVVCHYRCCLLLQVLLVITGVVTGILLQQVLLVITGVVCCYRCCLLLHVLLQVFCCCRCCLSLQVLFVVAGVQVLGQLLESLVHLQDLLAAQNSETRHLVPGTNRLHNYLLSASCFLLSSSSVVSSLKELMLRLYLHLYFRCFNILYQTNEVHSLMNIISLITTKVWKTLMTSRIPRYFFETKVVQIMPLGSKLTTPRGSQFYIDLYQENFKRHLLFNH